MKKEKAKVERLGYTLPEAAEAVGVSVDKLRQFIDRKELEATYIDHKPTIAVADLERWYAALPNERPSK